MVQITRVTHCDSYVEIEYLSNGISISTRVYDTALLSPQEIAEEGYRQLQPHIQMECDRLEIAANHDLPTVIDKVMEIKLFGTEDFRFTEGQKPIEKTFRCAGTTKYGKTVDLSETAEFTPSRTITITPTKSDSITVTATYNGLVASGTCNITFVSLAEIAEQNLAAEKAAEAEKALRLAEAKIARIESMNAACNIAIVTGFYSSVKFGTPKLYELQLENQLNMIGKMNELSMYEKLGMVTPETVSYYPKGEPCSDYAVVDFLQLCKEATTFKENCITKYKALAAQINSLTTIEEVNAVVW